MSPRPKNARTRSPEGIEAIRARIQSVEESSEHVNVVIFAHNGQGKTTFAASAPKCLVISIKEPDGTRSSRGRNTGAEKIECKNWQDVADAYWMLHNDLADGTCKYESVAIDTVSGLHAMAMDLVLFGDSDKDPTRGNVRIDPGDWGNGNKLLNGLVEAFCELELHTIMLCGERDMKDDDGDVIETTLALPPGSQGVVLGLGSIKGYMTREKVKKADGRRALGTVTQLEPTDEMPFLTDRTGKLGAAPIDLTMPQVIAAFRGEKPKAKTSTARRGTKTSGARPRPRRTTN